MSKKICRAVILGVVMSSSYVCAESKPIPIGNKVPVNSPSVNITTRAEQSKIDEKLDVETAELEKFTFNFKSGSSYLNQEELHLIQTLSLKNDEVMFVVIGNSYSDEGKGSGFLASQRSMKVKDELVNQGVDSNRIITLAHWKNHQPESKGFVSVYAVPRGAFSNLVLSNLIEI